MKIKPILIIACAALASVVESTVKATGAALFEVNYLSARWHNHPAGIPSEIQKVIREAKSSGKYTDIVVLYGDCGTDGKLDEMLKEENIQRIPGSQCSDILLASAKLDETISDADGNYYLTDYMVRYFSQISAPGLGSGNDHESRKQYLKHHKQLVYLAQTEDKELQLKAIDIADSLGLKYVYHYTGSGGVEQFLAAFSEKHHDRSKIH